MRTLLFIAGMARSGTSALARVLSLSGAFLPRLLVAPNASNPTGHWEPSVALRINDAFLAANGSSWYEPGLRLQADTVISASQEGRLIAKIGKFLGSEPIPEHGVMVIKDPRIPSLFDYWLAAARQAGFTPKIALIYRHPEEVAASLHVRDQLERDHSYLLWIKHNLLSERYTRRYQRTFLSFDHLIRDSHKEVSHLCESLEVDLEIPSRTIAEQFISEKYRHHFANSQVVDDPSPGRWADRVYTVLRSVSCGGVDQNELDSVFDEYVRWDRRCRTSLGLSSSLPWWNPLLTHMLRRQPRPRDWRHRAYK